MKTWYNPFIYTTMTSNKVRVRHQEGCISRRLSRSKLIFKGRFQVSKCYKLPFTICITNSWRICCRIVIQNTIRVWNTRLYNKITLTLYNFRQYIASWNSTIITAQCISPICFTITTCLFDNPVYICIIRLTITEDTVPTWLLIRNLIFRCNKRKTQKLSICSCLHTLNSIGISPYTVQLHRQTNIVSINSGTPNITYVQILTSTNIIQINFVHVWIWIPNDRWDIITNPMVISILTLCLYIYRNGRQQNCQNKH